MNGVFGYRDFNLPCTLCTNKAITLNFFEYNCNLKMFTIRVAEPGLWRSWQYKTLDFEFKIFFLSVYALELVPGKRFPILSDCSRLPRRLLLVSLNTFADTEVILKHSVILNLFKTIITFIMNYVLVNLWYFQPLSIVCYDGLVFLVFNIIYYSVPTLESRRLASPSSSWRYVAASFRD